MPVTGYEKLVENACVAKGGTFVEGSVRFDPCDCNNDCIACHFCDVERYGPDFIIYPFCKRLGKKECLSLGPQTPQINTETTPFYDVLESSQCPAISPYESCPDIPQVLSEECMDGGADNDDCYGLLNKCVGNQKCVKKDDMCKVEYDEECICKSDTAASNCDNDLDKCYEDGMRCIISEDICKLKRDFSYCCENGAACAGLKDSCEGINLCKGTWYVDTYEHCAVEENSSTCFDESQPTDPPSITPTQSSSAKNGARTKMLVFIVLVGNLWF